METHRIGGFGRSFLIAFVGVTVCTGLPWLWMQLTPPDPTVTVLRGLGQLILGLLLALGLPFVGALCASGRGVPEGALAGIAAAVGTWVAVGVVVSPELELASGISWFFLLAILAGLPLSLGYLVGRWIGARNEWPSDLDQPEPGAPSGHRGLGGHHH